MNWREEAGGVLGRLVEASLEAADPALAVERHWPSRLEAANGPVAVFSVGKGSVPMAREALRQLRRVGVTPERGLVITVPGQTPGAAGLGLEVMEADHPLASARNVAAARRLAELCDGLHDRWTVVFLISGGGSAHLASPREPLGLEELVEVTDALLRGGATIEELNCVRKHLETLKGGRLGARLAPAKVESLVLSDVLGDPLDVVASGPLAADRTTYAQALETLDRYGVRAETARQILQDGVKGLIPETPKPGGGELATITHRVIANNRAAVDAVCARLMLEGFEIARREDAVRGEAAEVGRRLGGDARRLVPGQALVAGGETTVRVGSGGGHGGRCQELALAAAIELEGAGGLWVAAWGTDGRDGPTDAAGAWADGRSVERAESEGVRATDSLRAHNSHAFFAASGGLIETGPTGTNVNDVWVALRR